MLDPHTVTHVARIPLIVLAALAALVPSARASAQMTPQAGSPRMIGIGHAESLLAASADELEGVLDEAVAPSWIEADGREGVLEAIRSVRESLSDARQLGAMPVDGTTAAVEYETEDGPVSLIVSVEADQPHRLVSLTLQR